MTGKPLKIEICVEGIDGLFVGRAAWTADGFAAVLQVGFAAHRMRGGWSS